MELNELIGRAVARKKGQDYDAFIAENCHSVRLPFTTSLYTVTEAVEVLCETDAQRQIFMERLCSGFRKRGWDWGTALIFAAMNATAQQKAEALRPIAETVLESE